MEFRFSNFTFPHNGSWFINAKRFKLVYFVLTKTQKQETMAKKATKRKAAPKKKSAKRKAAPKRKAAKKKKK